MSSRSPRKPPFVLLRRLSAQLKALRQREGLTLLQAADGLGWTIAKLSRVENAATAVSRRDLERLAAFYRLSGAERDRLMAKTARGRARRWRSYAALLPRAYADYIEVEEKLTGIRSFDALVVNGLLQTEAYARAVIEAGTIGRIAPAEVDRLVAARLVRQRRLRQQERPLRLWSVTTEIALRNMVGSPEIMKEQYRHLLEISTCPNVILQILSSTAGAHPGITGTFALLDFPDPPPLVFLETMMRVSYIEEPPEVEGYTLGFRRLREMACDSSGSRRLLAALLKRT